MNSWDISNLALHPHRPRILSSTDEARAIAMAIPAGESLADHQVHERAWITVLSGTVEITTASGEQVTGGPGLVVEHDPCERHAVRAISNARLLLLLTPWPGVGHPGGMTMDAKSRVVQDAAEHGSQARLVR